MAVGPTGQVMVTALGPGRKVELAPILHHQLVEGHAKGPTVLRIHVLQVKRDSKTSLRIATVASKSLYQGRALYNLMVGRDVSEHSVNVYTAERYFKY